MMITVIGSMNMDLLVTAQNLPDKGETNFGTGFRMSPGGKGANQAVAATRLGAEVKMIGCVGNDLFGEELTGALEQEGVDVSHISTSAKEPTGLANVIVSEADNRIIVVSGANNALHPSMISELKGVIGESSLVVLQMEILPETVEAVLAYCQERRIPVLLNPAPATHFKREWMEFVTLLTPNKKECESIFGENIEAVLEQYPNQLIVTLGEEGARYYDGEKHVHIPIFPTDVVDTTGAGDTFNGALAYGFAHGYQLEEAMLFANAAGSLAVEKLGAQSGMPRIEDVWKRMGKASGTKYT